jgi:uncharacterized protein (TIGR02099 family)
MLFAILIITAAVISGLFRALTPWAAQYKTQVEHHISRILGQPVSINTMETGWYWFEPVVKLNQVEVLGSSKAALKLNKLLIGIDVFRSLWHWQLQPGVLFVDDLRLTLHQTPQGWRVDGLSNIPNMALDESSVKLLLNWVLAQQKIMLRHVSANIYLEDGSLLPLDDLNLIIVNHSGRYRIKGSAYLNQTIPSKFALLATLKLEADNLQKASGQLFVSVQDLLTEQWQKLIPKFRWQVSGGTGDMQLWTELKRGEFKSIQSRLSFDHLLITDAKTEKDQFIHSVKANLAWNATQRGWQLSGDHINVRLSGTSWRENAFVLRREGIRDYFVYVKNIKLASLLETAIPLPTTILSSVIARSPHGELHDTQLKLDEMGGIQYVLTRFAHLGWLPSKEYPGVDNLAGVLHWEPTEGRLEVDSHNMTFTPIKQAPLLFPVVNAAIDWKELPQGLRVSMERLVLSHPNLLFSAQGVADEVSVSGMGALRMHAQFSVHQGEKWLPYLPSNYLKPNLAAWLKRDVKQIRTGSGEIIINGNMADFPFDRGPGIFSIKSYLSGVDLIFAPKWPVTRQIEAYLNVNKRDLTADIVHADLQGIDVEEANLRVTDLGLDKEVLFIHAKAETEAKKALSYVQLSPLSKKLPTLKILQMEGALDLDLQLEAPLYPENDNVLALGNLIFKNNQVTVRHSLNNIELHDLNGSLQFDQGSILDSELTASLLGSPITLAMKSVLTPIPATQVKVKGQTTAAALREKLKLPLFSLFQGSFWVESLLTLTDEPSDLDHLQIQSSLVGLKIDLPSPLGKTAQASKPAVLTIDFNPKKAIRLRFNYFDRLSSDLWFSEHRGAFTLQRGKIALGTPLRSLNQEKRNGLQIVGSLADFDLQQWLKIKEKISKHSAQAGLPEAMNLVDIQLKTAKIFNQNYKDVSMKAIKMEKGEWAFHLNQENIAANLRYYPESNTLKGLFEKLHLEKFNPQGSLSHAAISKLKPKQMPNLDLRIASFQVGDWNIGDMTLKATQLDNDWQINYCKIKSPHYELIAKGEWKDGIKEATKLQGDLAVNNLAKTLAGWKISPVVEANSGKIKFQGGWAGSIYDFSLSKVSGEMAIHFKDGRITNLSPETEEKLGLGKLLSILSLQTIPRRLKLDFSDLAEDGYSFDDFKGNFAIAQGVMTTQDSYIEGPVAYATMKGNLDIAKQYYDLDLKVNPHITASLPVVATIAGGPIAGIATWVASKLINNGMQKISGYTYKITGPWRQPVVQQVKIIKKRNA